MARKIFSIFAFVLLVGCNNNSNVTETKDYLKVLESLAIENQEKLDTGIDMLGTEINYYSIMDSMLNVVYNDLMSSLGDSNRTKLTINHRNWILSRDSIFKEFYKPVEEEINNVGFASEIERLEFYNSKSEYFRNRIIQLLEMIENKN